MNLKLRSTEKLQIYAAYIEPKKKKNVHFESNVKDNQQRTFKDLVKKS